MCIKKLLGGKGVTVEWKMVRTKHLELWVFPYLMSRSFSWGGGHRSPWVVLLPESLGRQQETLFFSSLCLPTFLSFSSTQSLLSQKEQEVLQAAECQPGKSPCIAFTLYLLCQKDCAVLLLGLFLSSLPPLLLLLPPLLPLLLLYSLLHSPNHSLLGTFSWISWMSWYAVQRCFFSIMDVHIVVNWRGKNKGMAHVMMLTSLPLSCFWERQTILTKLGVVNYSLFYFNSRTNGSLWKLLS